MSSIQYYGTGRRKTSTARVFLRPGTGTITVNRREFEDFFPTDVLRTEIKQPLLLTETADKFDVLATVAGGGIAGQAGAVRLGICARAVRVQPRAAPGAEEGRPAHARRAGQGTQEVRAGRRAQALPVQQAVIRPASVTGRTIERDRHQGTAGGRGALRPPDQALEPEDEAVHLRRAQRHLHHRPGQDGQAVPRRRGVRQPGWRPTAARCSSWAPSARPRTRWPKKPSAAGCTS